MKSKVSILDVDLYDFFLYSIDSYTHREYVNWYSYHAYKYDELYSTSEIIFIEEDEKILKEFFNEK